MLFRSLNLMRYPLLTRIRLRLCLELECNKGSNIDYYITKFAKLARKAQYHKDDPAVLEKFKHGLPVRLLKASMHHDQPANWEQWKLSTHKRQAILTSIEPHRQAFFTEKKAKKPFFSRNNKGEFNPHRGGTSNAMDTSASLSKAVTEADKERYKKEGRCFFCGVQGHVSCSCSKETVNPQKNPPAKIATVVEDTTPTLSVTSQTTTFTHENVLNYLKDLLVDEYQQMAEAWGSVMISPLSYHIALDSYQTYGLLTHYAYLHSDRFLVTIPFPVRYLLSDDARLFVLVESFFAYVCRLSCI